MCQTLGRGLIGPISRHVVGHNDSEWNIGLNYELYSRYRSHYEQMEQNTMRNTQHYPIYDIFEYNKEWVGMTRLPLLSGSDRLGDGLGVGDRSDVIDVAEREFVLIHWSGGSRRRGTRKRSPAWRRRGFCPAAELTWSSSSFSVFRGEA